MSDTTSPQWAHDTINDHRFIEGGAVAFGDAGLGKCTCREHMYRGDWDAHLAEKIHEKAVSTFGGNQ
ncbi:hypothetical protein [Aeromicrobium sp. 179-A 4D2 NHS]|uniref:hypothetical protein n=1 Tax=Aeromicrobium sp. 179-A 4D2 NHS TaxID=3142375 RepID=UPI0039A277B4